MKRLILTVAMCVALHVGAAEASKPLWDGQTLDGWHPAPLHASMFGSAARADGDTRSDIDLLIVRPVDIDEDDAAWRAHVSSLADAVNGWTGNRAGIIELGEAELEGLRRRPPPILANLGDDAIDLAGLPVRALLKARR